MPQLPVTQATAEVNDAGVLLLDERRNGNDRCSTLRCEAVYMSGPFLHGCVGSAAETSVVWHDFLLTNGREGTKPFLSTASVS